jgi:CrcB protein
LRSFVFLGSGLGSAARHLLNNFVTAFAGIAFPWGILAINVTGSTAIVLVAGWFAYREHASADVLLFLTTGILGGYTTFSAFSMDPALRYERGQLARLGCNVCRGVRSAVDSRIVCRVVDRSAGVQLTKPGGTEVTLT